MRDDAPDCAEIINFGTVYFPGVPEVTRTNAIVSIVNCDSDSDGLIDQQDNCPYAANADQHDRDGDGIGDPCDDDADGDGYIAESIGGDDCNDADPLINPGTARQTTTTYLGSFVVRVDDYAAQPPTADVALSASVSSGAVPVGWEVGFEIVRQDGTVVERVIGPLDEVGTVRVTATDVPVGVYTVKADFRGDGCYYRGSEDYATIAVYDPTGGFATGGGWYIAADDVTGSSGRANFGFNVKYKSEVASGNLEFQFQAGDLNLKSTAISWLAMSQTNAQFRGQARVNGLDGFFFRVIARDVGDPGVGTDEFDIKIWQGDPESAEATLVHSSKNILGGGSIVVHR